MPKPDKKQSKKRKQKTSAALLSTSETVKPFKLVQNFTSISLILIFVATLVLSMALTQEARTVLMQKNEEYARLLANNLNYQVFQQFVIRAVKEHGKIQLSDERQFQSLDSVVRHAIHGFNVDMVNIYNTSSQIIYSFNPDLVGKKMATGMEYKHALAGKSSSRLMQSGASWEIWMGFPAQSKLRTYTCFAVEDPESGELIRVLGVFEVVQDLSSDYREIFNFQLVVVGVSAGVMLVIFLILRFYVGRGEAILMRRAEERLKLEEQLSHAERLASLGEMAAGVSHEIRNPLGIIRSSAELLGKSANGVTNQLLGVIIEESSRLNDIITEFLDFSRPPKPKFTKCEIQDVLNKNLTFLSPRMKAEGYRVSTNFGKDLPGIQADPNLLYQSFLNILINSMQAMPQSGEIFIDVTYDKDNLTVSFIDEGPGVDEKILKKIWNPFFTTKDRGTGLGLCVVRNIIKSHSGSVVIENAAEKGACVRVRLPIEAR